VKVLDFIGYPHWRREETDRSRFWTEEWQERYREAKADLTEGRFRDFDDVEDLLAELKGQSGISA
jgi:phosphoglycolate phosphatase-like HAD superfamily hydrolase